MERIFALYDSDVFYVTRFMEYFKRKKDSNFAISVFTKKESFEEFISLYSIDILLVGIGISIEDIPKDRIKNIYLLTESPIKEAGAQYPEVFKYQPAKAVLEETITDFLLKENKLQINLPSNKVQIISVFSPIQNAESLVHAWAIAAIWAEQQKILLIILDIFPISIGTSYNNTNSALTEFIYYLKENPNIIVKMKDLLSLFGNLSVLSGITHGADILSLNKADINLWVEELRTHTDYQRVIFYQGGYFEASTELMKLSDTIIITDRGTPYERAVYSTWSRQMRQVGINTEQDKFNRMILQEDQGLGYYPLSLSEITNTQVWRDTKQNLDRFD